MKGSTFIIRLVLLLCCIPLLVRYAESKTAGKPVVNAPVMKHTPNLWPKIKGHKSDMEIENHIHALLSTMSLDRKIGQMVQIDIRSFTPEDMKKYRFGSVLNGGGCWPQQKKDAPAAEWVALADSIWHACVADLKDPVPPLWGTDAVHGHNNVSGATLFPHNIGLGAAHDTSLMFRIGQATALEVAATGINWNFAPTVAVARDDRWGRTYESYSEMPELVAAYAEKIISGMQGTFGDSNVLATAKHYLGDGGTDNGDDRGNTTVTEAKLMELHAAGYYAAIKAGVQVVMASYNRWQGVRMHENAYLLQDILKERLGFDGFVVSDWNAIEEVEGCTKSSCPKSVNAGVDMFMVPFKEDWKPFIDNLKAQVASGEVPMARIDDAVSRILRVKLRMGLFEQPSPAKRACAGKSELLNSREHRALAREAVRKSLVLLKNNNAVLPLQRDARILVAGCGADSIPLQAGGWTITWQGDKTTNADFKQATSILAGIRSIAKNVHYSPNGENISKENYDVAVVVIGERPYAEFRGDIEGGLTLEHAKTYPEDLALLKKIQKTGVPVVTVFLSGRPLCINKELNSSEAFVAAWLPGSEGGGIADVLFSSEKGTITYDFRGKLSFSWPKMPCDATVNFNDIGYDPLFPLGYGLTYKSNKKSMENVQEFVMEGYGCTGLMIPPIKADSVVTIYNGVFSYEHYPWMGGPDNWEGKAGLPKSAIQNLEVQIANDKQNKSDKAIRLQFKGEAYWSLGGKDKDMSACVASDFAIVFDVCVMAVPVGDIAVAVLCTYPCQGEVNITSQLKAMSIGTWGEIRIPLKRFASVDFLRVSSAFQLNTTGAADVIVANVRWQK